MNIYISNDFNYEHLFDKYLKRISKPIIHSQTNASQAVLNSSSYPKSNNPFLTGKSNKNVIIYSNDGNLNSIADHQLHSIPSAPFVYSPTNFTYANFNRSSNGLSKSVSNLNLNIQEIRTDQPINPSSSNRQNLIINSDNLYSTDSSFDDSVSKNPTNSINKSFAETDQSRNPTKSNIVYNYFFKY